MKTHCIQQCNVFQINWVFGTNAHIEISWSWINQIWWCFQVVKQKFFFLGSPPRIHLNINSYVLKLDLYTLGGWCHSWLQGKKEQDNFQEKQIWITSTWWLLGFHHLWHTSLLLFLLSYKYNLQAWKWSFSFSVQGHAEILAGTFARMSPGWKMCINRLKGY